MNPDFLWNDSLNEIHEGDVPYNIHDALKEHLLSGKAIDLI